MLLLLFSGGGTPSGAINVRDIVGRLLPSLHVADIERIEYWTEDELIGYASEGLRALAAKLCLFTERSTVTTVQDQALYSYPARHIHSIYSALDGTTLRPATVAELSALDDTYRTAPSAPYYVDALVKFELPDADYSQCGIGVQASSSGARLFFGPFEDTGSNIYGLLFTNPTTFSAARGTRRKRIDRLVWLRLNDTNTNHVLSWSPDGKNWTQYLSQGRTADFTPVDLIFAANSTANVAGACMLLSWKETSGNP